MVKFKTTPWKTRVIRGVRVRDRMITKDGKNPRIQMQEFRDGKYRDLR